MLYFSFGNAKKIKHRRAWETGPTYPENALSELSE